MSVIKYWFKRETIDRITIYWDYMQTMEDALVEELRKFDKNIGKYLANVDYEMIHIAGLKVIGIRRILIEDLPNIFRYGLFVNVYFEFEAVLDDLCNWLSYKYDYALSPKDLKDRGINRSQTYLKKIVDVDFPDQSKEWMNIKRYLWLRNKIAHNGGYIDFEEEKDYQKNVKDLNGVSLKDNKIILEKEFCENMIKEGLNFFKKLFKEIDDKKLDWEEERYMGI